MEPIILHNIYKFSKKNTKLINEIEMAIKIWKTASFSGNEEIARNIQAIISIIYTKYLVRFIKIKPFCSLPPKESKGSLIYIHIFSPC